ncbi:MAG: type 1 glutamine amidotransferase [Ilumatobacteraceae bacterium]
MRALVVQHEHAGPAGLRGEHLRARGYEVVDHLVMHPGSTESHHPFPDPTAFDLVVPLGSVHGVYERDVIGTWIDREIAMLRTAHGAGVPVFGICFGAQAMCAALGGQVEKAPGYEVGWYAYDTDVPEVIAAGPWFTWHGDRCLLPDGDEAPDVLARNSLCTQAYRRGRSVGVQFHPEATPELVGAWVAKCPPGYFASHATTADAVLGGFATEGDALRARAITLFEWFLDEVAPS